VVSEHDLLIQNSPAPGTRNIEGLMNFLRIQCLLVSTTHVILIALTCRLTSLALVVSLTLVVELEHLLAVSLPRAGLDPVQASRKVAQTKPRSDHVTWIHTALNLPPLAIDLATMTAKVAQAFLTDEE